MSYRCKDSREAVRIARALSDAVPQPGNQYRARRYPDGQRSKFAPPVWGVIELQPVPESLRHHWPSGFKPCGFVWNPAQLLELAQK